LLLEEAIEIQSLHFLAQKAMEGYVTGIHRSPLRGHSVEFAEHRPYNEGENIKNLDWKLLAKTEKKYIKEYVEETNLKCHLFLDVSKSMYYPENHAKLKFSVLAASSLLYTMQKQRDAFRISIYDDEIVRWESEIRSTRSHLNAIVSQLEHYWSKNNPTTNSKQLFSYQHFIKGIKKRNVVVFISDLLFPNGSDAYNEFWNTLSYLHYLKCEVVVLHVNDAQSELELDVNLGDQPLKFVDIETNEVVKLTPEEIASEYQNTEKARRKKIREKCLELGISFVDCNVSQPIENVLNAFYTKRNSRS
jgi:uncharacterized protein (DUF58 family)